MKINNFDFLRHFLAFSVVWHHFNILSRYDSSFIFLDIINSDIAVKAFFVISGLLIWVSATRTTNWHSYFIKRFLRLYPALILILVIVSAVTLFEFQQSTTDVVKYFAWNSIFLSFMNPCIGDVFDSNVLCAVNGSLWTLKLEVAYYVFVGVTVYKFKKYAYKLIVIFTVLSFLLESFLYFLPVSYTEITQLLHNQIPFKFYYFGMGVIFYNYYKKVSTAKLFCLLVIGFIGWYLLKIDFIFLPLFVLSFVYIVAFKLPAFNFSKFGDLSYGMYIFHFPLIQMFVYKGWFVNVFYIDFLMIMFFLLLMSKLSWDFIENKSIHLSKVLSKKIT
jgi:peptidoglycan/LPS O-acetylase OafA/YrhL